MGRAEILIDLIKETKAEHVIEIGLGRGRTIRNILESECRDTIKEYWGVDPWTTECSRDSHYRDQAFFDKEACDVCKLMLYFPQLRILRMTSVEASEMFFRYEKHFDLVFIDAEHDYDNVKKDILTWRPLVSDDGILCGHDYASREKDVIRAVNEIFGVDNIKVAHPGSVWIHRSNKKEIVKEESSKNLNTGIWDLETAKKRHRYDKKLAEFIGAIYKSADSIADVGCGVGDYCKHLKELGVSIVHGYEGTVGIEKIASYRDIMVVDLTKERWVGINYDLVLCLEVGEHIPKKHEQVFIDNLCRYVGKDLIISWAIPKQGGNGHVNEMDNDYVIREFSKRGLVFDKASSMKLREVSSLKWFKNTLMKFEKV